MSAAQTNTLYRTPNPPRASGATSLRRLEMFDDLGECAAPPQPRGLPVGVFIRNAAVWSERYFVAPEQGSTLIGCLAPKQYGGAFDWSGLTEVIRLREALDLDLGAPVVSSHHVSRIVVRARVTIRTGRLNLVVPEILTEGE